MKWMLALGVAALLVGSWLVSRWMGDLGREQPIANPSSAPLVDQGVAGQSDSLVETAELDTASLDHLKRDPSARTRSSARSTALEGQVMDSDGEPVIGAQVTWTPIDPSRFLAVMQTTLEQRDALSNATLVALTDSKGRFEFESTPTPGGASVLWVTAGGFEGQAIATEHAFEEVVRVVLSRSPPRAVRVVDEAGVPVAGALVEHYGASALSREHGNPLLIAAGKAFRRLSTTNADGVPQPGLMPCIAGEVIVARVGDSSTDSWIESRNDRNPEIVLRLGDTFACLGQVRSSDPEFNLEGLVIEARGLAETYSGPLAVARVEPDGSWGPISVAWREDWSYTLSVSGPGAANELISIGRPTLGSTVRKDIELVPGISIPVSVSDKRSVPVAHAQLTAQWVSGELGVASYSTTDAEGMAVVRNVRPGWVRLFATAEGFTDYSGDWLELTAPLGTPLTIELVRSRVVRGRVLGSNEPVEDFRVIYWTTADLSTSTTSRSDFEGRSDGSFELDSAPRETIWLMAAADGFSRSGFVRADPGLEDEVVLELLPSCSVTAVVVDAETKAPIPGSSVQLYMNRGNQYLDARNAPVVVDAEGRFELDSLAPGDNRLVVEAPGYSRYLGVAFGEPGRTVDMGAIAMQRTRSLALVLVGDGPVDASGYTANLKGTRYHEPVTFGADGVAVFENVSPGIATWRVDGPDGFVLREIHVLAPDVEWIFEVPVEGGPVLEVELVSPTGGAVPRGLTVAAFATPGPGVAVPGMESMSWAALDDEGRARIRGLAPGPVAVEVFGPDEDTVASAHGVLEYGGTRLEVVWTSREHTFRVVDEAGGPVSEADVFLIPGSQTTTWNQMVTTDVSGEATARGLPFDDVLVGAKHPELGFLPMRSIRLSEEGGSTTLRFGDRGGLDVLLLEGGAPSPGTQVSLFTGGTFVVGDVASDGEGRLRWPNLAAGTYDLRVVHPGFWPGHARVPTSEDGGPVELVIHRRGAIQLRLITGADQPVSGQTLELEHVGLGETPQDWLELGLIGWDQADLLSDGQGRVVLDGWPRGTYRWTAERPGGATDSGEFELGPGANPMLELRLK